MANLIAFSYFRRPRLCPSISSMASSYNHREEEEEDVEEDQALADFLESEILSSSHSAAATSNQEGGGEEEKLQQPKQQLVLQSKRRRLDPDDGDDDDVASSSGRKNNIKKTNRLPRIPGAQPPCPGGCSNLMNIPPEVFHHILKFLSSEDLISCSLVCTFMNLAASDESLWRRLYCMRWGLASPAGKLHTCPWKKLYIQRDREDMLEFIRSTPSEFKEYYIQMQAAKRSQAPLLSQVNDDRVTLDRTVADQVSIWRSKRGLTDELLPGHVCSGNTCTYSQIGDVFLCDKTGRVHVCDDTCREVVLDPSSGILVCTISGHCFDRLLSPEEELDAEQQAGMTDEAEPFMGSGRFARAYLLGYNCADEKELEATLRFC